MFQLCTCSYASTTIIIQNLTTLNLKISELNQGLNAMIQVLKTLKTFGQVQNDPRYCAIFPGFCLKWNSD